MSRDGGRELWMRRGPSVGGGGPLSPGPAPSGEARGDTTGLEQTAVAPLPSRAAPEHATPVRSEDGLGGYQFGHHLGQTGDVYEAEHPRFQGRLALKMFKRAAGGAVDAFAREAGRVSILRHPHIAQVMEAGALRDGTPFVSMELLDGQPLDELLGGRGALLASELLPLVRGIASALAAAHAAGIVHRELRPDNIFVVKLEGYEHGFAKVLDFGVSRLTAAERATGRGPGLRAPSYLAPEQLAGRIEDITPAADQFALGALTYRLLSGSDPFVAHARPRGLDRVLEGKAGGVAPLARRAPAVDAVVSKAMSRHPGDRFESVALFFRAFEEALAGSALISTPLPLVAREAATPRAAEVPGPLATADAEPTRRTLYGQGPPSQLMRDVPTREVSLGTEAVDPSASVTTPPPVAVPAAAAVEPAAQSGPTRRRSVPLVDEGALGQRFFEEGDRQESERFVRAYSDASDSAGRLGFNSFDRVPKRRGPVVIAVLMLVGAGAGAAWWAGWRPPRAWQESPAWKALRLPPLGPPPASPSAPAEPAAAAITGEGAAAQPEAAGPTGAPPSRAANDAPAGSPGAGSAATAPTAAGEVGEARPAPPDAPATGATAGEAPAARARTPSTARPERRPGALDGFVWSPAERAYVPAPLPSPAP